MIYIHKLNFFALEMLEVVVKSLGTDGSDDFVSFFPPTQTLSSDSHDFSTACCSLLDL